MSTASRDSLARILVRVSSSQNPHIRRHCPRCAADRRFRSSGKFRVNAQRKSIDAWLIFLCADCDYRWNLPIHERRPVKAIDPAERQALMRNDPALADRLAAGAGNAASEVVVTPALATPIGQDTSAIALAIAVASPCTLRLERLLAMVLGLRREEIRALCSETKLYITPAAGKALRRPALDGQTVHLDLSSCPLDLAARCRMQLAAWPVSSPGRDRPD